MAKKNLRKVILGFDPISGICYSLRSVSKFNPDAIKPTDQKMEVTYDENYNIVSKRIIQ